MSGAPRAAYTSGEFIAVRRDVVTELGSWEAAGVWHRICWRAERTGSWVAPIQEVAEECCLSEHKTRAALNVIRDAGWITATRASGRDRTLSWVPVWADGPNIENPRYVTSKIPATPSIETVETPPTPQGEQTALFPSAAPVLTVEVSKDTDSSEFIEWYGLFPRKIAKGDARKAWRQVTRRTPAAVITAGLRRQLAYLRGEHQRGFCPYPASWLRDERWEDQHDNVHPIRPPDPPVVRNSQDPFARGVL